MNWFNPLNFFMIVLIALGLMGGCAHYPINHELQQRQPQSGYRFNQLPAGENTDSLFICLAFSGGGTRAAAFSYGLLELLKNTKIEWEGRTKRLLDEVDCISSISGGSFTAAYYGLFGDRIFSDFRTRFLERDIQGELISALFNPINLFRVASPYYGRIDMAAELYHRSVFDKATFNDLQTRAQRPFLIINATNVANGTPFEFTQEQFDLLGSALSTYPVARAVAASSAFPFLLSPISLKNHPLPQNDDLSHEYPLTPDDYEDNRRYYQWAKNHTWYLDKTQRPFTHLMDGGLSDNIGLRAIDVAYRRGFIRQRLNSGAIKTLVILVANARTDPLEEISRQEKAPGLSTVAYKTATISMDNYSFDTVELMKSLVDERRKAQRNIMACQGILDKRGCGEPPLPKLASEIDPYVIELNLEAIQDQARRTQFLNLPTNFSLTAQQVQDLIEVSAELMRQSPEYQRLLEKLGAS